MRKFAQLTFTILTLALVSLAASAPAQAQTLTDPADLFIGNPSTCPDSTSCPYLYGGTEVIGVFPGSVDMVLNGQSATTTIGQLILIIGVPNPPGGSPPSIDKVNGVSLGTPINATLGATMISTSKDAYTLLSLNGDGSQNWTNWSGADCAVLSKCSVTSFSIYEYALTGYTLSGKGTPLTLSFSGSGLPLGTFVFGWGCETSLPCSMGNSFSTPFTQTGLVVPEPGSLALLGTGLLALGGAIRRRWTGSRTA